MVYHHSELIKSLQIEQHYKEGATIFATIVNKGRMKTYPIRGCLVGTNEGDEWTISAAERRKHIELFRSGHRATMAMCVDEDKDAEERKVG